LLAQTIIVLFLETCTAEVSSGRACPEEGKPSPVEEAARKDSAVHVSLSSDSLVKQPGDHGDPPSRKDREAAEARIFRPKSDDWSPYQ